MWENKKCVYNYIKSWYRFFVINNEIFHLSSFCLGSRYLALCYLRYDTRYLTRIIASNNVSSRDEACSNGKMQKWEHIYFAVSNPSRMFLIWRLYSVDDSTKSHFFRRDQRSRCQHKNLTLFLSQKRTSITLLREVLLAMASAMR